MKKTLICILLSIISLGIYSQEIKERKVYYLDCSQSMRGSKQHPEDDIWEEVIDSLKAAIRDVVDEQTELYVIPFAFDDSYTHKCLDNYKMALATRTGKKALIDYIDNLPDPRTLKTKTYHKDPINDFLKRIDPNKATYLFLMTDGRDEGKEDRLDNVFENVVRDWNSITRNKEVYGIYVMLNSKYDDKQRHNLIDKTENFWQLNTANVNVNLIKLQKEVTLNIRNDDYIDIKLARGYVKNNTFNIKTPNDFPVHLIKPKKIDEQTIRFNVDTTGVNIHKLDSLKSYVCSVSNSSVSEFDRLLTPSIIVKVINTYEKWIKTVRPESRTAALPWYKTLFYDEERIPVLGRVEYYPSFLTSQSQTKPIKVTLKFSFSPDAIERNSFADFQFVDNNGRAISDSILIIKENGKLLRDNIIHVSSKDTIKVIEVSFSSEANEGQYQGYFRLIKHDLNRINSTTIAYNQCVDDYQWTILFEKKWNPLLVNLLWLLLLFVSLCILGLYIIWQHRAFSLRFPTEGRAVFAPIANSFNIQLQGKNYKNITIVQPGGSDTILSEQLNPFYIKEIIVINPNINNPFVPKPQSFWDRIWNGERILITGVFAQYPIHHIILKPSGVITKEDIEMTFNYSIDESSHNIILPIHEITMAAPSTQNIAIPFTDVVVYGNRPVNAVQRSLFHKIINISIKIFKH